MLDRDEFQLGPSPWGELLLLFGTNTETNGGYNLEDVKSAGYLSDDPAIRASAPEKALEMAHERVTRDPGRFLAFAATEKVQRLWGRERSLNHWSLGGYERAESYNYYVRGSAIVAADGAYRMVLLLFVVGLAVQLRRPGAFGALGGLVMVYALPHIFIEVQPRYHLPMLPFMLIGATLTFHRLLPNAQEVAKRVYGARSWVRRDRVGHRG